MDKLFISIKDFLSFKFLMFSLIPLIISSVFFFGLLGYIINLLANIDINEDYFNFVLGIYILHAIQIAIMLISGIGGSFLAMHLSVFFALFIVSFLTPMIVKEINTKHYNYIKSNEVSLTRVVLLMSKIFVQFLIMFFFTLLFYIIPIVNIFASMIMFFVFFFLYYHFLVYDVASCVLNKDDFDNFKAKKFEYIFWVFIFYLICNIPVIGFFLQVFFVIMLAHLMFDKELKMKALIDYK